MGRAKITVVGAGNVGASVARTAAEQEIADVVLIDIVEGLAEGKALDMAEASPVQLYDISVAGTTDWSRAEGSSLVIITSGVPRKPGMSRDDLLAKNASIVKAVSEEVKSRCRDSIVIVVCNPLDAMTYAVSKVTGFDKQRVMGMAGALDSARFCHFIASELQVSVEDVKGVLMGGHGDDMVPLPRFTSVGGIGLSELLDKERIDALIERTRKGGIEIVNLLGYSAYYAPAAGVVKMAEAILRDKRSVIPCCAYCDAEYGAGGCFVGVPAVLGAKGVERVVELKLNEREQAAFEKSLAHVKELVTKVDELV